MARRWPPARHRRPDTGHPLSAGALRPEAHRSVDPDGHAARRAGRRGSDRRHRRAEPHRVAAAVVGRRGHAPRDRQVHAVGAPGRALVPEQHRVHSPHQRSARYPGRARHGVQRPVSGAGAGRRLPRRAGGHTDRPAPSARDHQVQPGAHLDAGKRGRHRRRLPVRLRHGRPGGLPVRRPHRADVEPLEGP